MNECATNNPDHCDDAADIEKILAALDSGGLAIIPLDVAYGFATSTEDGLKKIMELKRRPADRPCVVLGSPRVFNALADSSIDISRVHSPVGLVVKLKNTPGINVNIPPLALYKNTVAIFLNMGEFGQTLANTAFDQGKIIMGSSANVSNTGNNYSLEDVESEIRSAVNIEIDRGPSKYQEFTPDGRAIGATIVDISEKTPKLVRGGLCFNSVIQELKDSGVEIK